MRIDSAKPICFIVPNNGKQFQQIANILDVVDVVVYPL